MQRLDKVFTELVQSDDKGQIISFEFKNKKDRIIVIDVFNEKYNKTLRYSMCTGTFRGVLRSIYRDWYLTRTSMIKDDLTKVRGIGQATADKLYNAGIGTFEQLAEITTEQIETIGLKDNFKDTAILAIDLIK